MAKKTNNNYKAEFCQQYFYQLKGFVEKFNVNSNNLGMNFLLDAYGQNVTYRNKCYWTNIINGQPIDIKEEDLMLAIEEFYEITNSLQDQRESLFKGLLYPDQYATDEDLITTVFVNNEQMLRAILSYFGIKDAKDKNKTVENVINMYETFAQFVKGQNNQYTIRYYSNALHLWQQNRNDRAHSIIKQQDVSKRKIAFLFQAFTYIGLVYLMRQTWKLRKAELSKYSAPNPFVMRSQKLKVSVRTADSSNDTIIKYEFIPNIAEPTKPVVENIDPTQHLEKEFSVCKYQNFMLKVTYGTAEGEPKTISFGDVNNGQDPLMLNYFYWWPSLEIRLPESKNLQPGFAPTGNGDIDGKIVQMFAEANKQKDEAVRVAMMTGMEKFYNSIKSELDSIKAQGENIMMLSRQQEERRNQQIEKIKSTLEKQASKNEQFLESIKSDTSAIKEDTGDLKNKTDVLLKLVEKLYEKSFSELGVSTPDKLKSDKTLFWLKHIPSFGILIGAIVAFCCSLLNDYSLNYLGNKFWWYAIPALLILVSCASVFIARQTTVSNHSSILKPYTACVGWGSVILAAMFFGLSIWSIPYKSIERFVANYDFEEHEQYENDKVCKTLKFVLEESPYNDEVRVKLATFYYENGDNDNAIVEVSKIQNDSLPSAMVLKGRMLVFGGYDYTVDNVTQGKNILENAANQGNNTAKYWLGIFYSNMQLIETNRSRTACMEYDLIKAVKYLREASSLPKAASALGRLYEDLNMRDSAMFYYEKAIFSVKFNNIEAKFRVWLLCKKMNLLELKYNEDIIDYPPAQLYKALHKEKKDHKVALAFYKAYGNSERYKEYNGSYRYVPPIVVEYIESKEKGRLDSALYILQNMRKEAHFNKTFVEGLEYGSRLYALTKKTDSQDEYQIMWERWIHTMRKSAYPKEGQGCLYAEMLCLYIDILQLEDNISLFGPDKMEYLKVDSLKSRLKKISEVIPYAKVLMSDISGGNSDYWGSSALVEGHPAGAIVLGLHYNKRIDKTDDIVKRFLKPVPMPEPVEFKNSWSKRDSTALLWEYYRTSLLLRIWPSEEKGPSIYYGYILDRIKEYIRTKKDSYIDENMHFWCDVAIANKSFYNEAVLLQDYVARSLQEKQYGIDYYKNEPYVEKLIRSLLRDIPKNSPVKYSKLISLALYQLSDELKESLYIQYQGDPFRRSIIEESIKNGQYFGEDCTFNVINAKDYSKNLFNIRTIDLMWNECSDVIDKYIY